MKNLIWFLIAGTRGGNSRARIIKLLSKSPTNMHQVSKKLKLDYKTVLHHMLILEEHHIVTIENKGRCGAVFFLSEITKQHIKDFKEIWERIGI